MWNKRSGEEVVGRNRRSNAELVIILEFDATPEADQNLIVAWYP